MTAAATPPSCRPLGRCRAAACCAWALAAAGRARRRCARPGQQTSLQALPAAACACPSSFDCCKRLLLPPRRWPGACAHGKSACRGIQLGSWEPWNVQLAAALLSLDESLSSRSVPAFRIPGGRGVRGENVREGGSPDPAHTPGCSCVGAQMQPAASAQQRHCVRPRVGGPTSTLFGHPWSGWRAAAPSEQHQHHWRAQPTTRPGLAARYSTRSELHPADGVLHQPQAAGANAQAAGAAQQQQQQQQLAGNASLRTDTSAADLLVQLARANPDLLPAATSAASSTATAQPAAAVPLFMPSIVDAGIPPAGVVPAAQPTTTTQPPLSSSGSIGGGSPQGQREQQPSSILSFSPEPDAAGSSVEEPAPAAAAHKSRTPAALAQLHAAVPELDDTPAHPVKDLKGKSQVSTRAQRVLQVECMEAASRSRRAKAQHACAPTSPARDVPARAGQPGGGGGVRGAGPGRALRRAHPRRRDARVLDAAGCLRQHHRR